MGLIYFTLSFRAYSDVVGLKRTFYTFWSKYSQNRPVDAHHQIFLLTELAFLSSDNRSSDNRNTILDSSFNYIVNSLSNTTEWNVWIKNLFPFYTSHTPLPPALSHLCDYPKQYPFETILSNYIQHSNSSINPLILSSADTRQFIDDELLHHHLFFSLLHFSYTLSRTIDNSAHNFYALLKNLTTELITINPSFFKDDHRSIIKNYIHNTTCQSCQNALSNIDLLAFPTNNQHYSNSTNIYPSHTNPHTVNTHLRSRNTHNQSNNNTLEQPSFFPLGYH